MLAPVNKLNVKEAMMQGTVLAVKVGLVEEVVFENGSKMSTAIRKKPVEQAVVHALGAEGNDVALKAHHGGVDKALFFMAEKSFVKLTALLGKDYGYQGEAIYGENFVVSAFDEENVCVGDRYQIGEVQIEISQPRVPCETLGKNANNKDTRKIVVETGLTGWYVRVIKNGVIKKGDAIQRLANPYPNLTIKHLNALLAVEATEEIKAPLEQAIDCPVLAEAFRRHLKKQWQKIR